MSTQKTNSSESGTFAEMCKRLHIGEIRKNGNGYSREELPLLIECFKGSEEGCEKFTALVSAVDEESKLEEIGKNLTKELFLRLLIKKEEGDPTLAKKISPLLVGMPHDTFNELLLTIPPPLIHTLQEEGATEPLQHQLTLTSHELAHHIEDFAEKSEKLSLHIESLTPERISHQTIAEIHGIIKKYKEELENSLFLIERALQIAWNTNRPDLIEVFSMQKEIREKLLIHTIGKPRAEALPSTGHFYLLLERTLNTIFSNPDNPRDIEALKDHEPAIEALVKFSLWYLRDYWEIGLLPAVKSAEELDLDPERSSSRERADHRAALFSSVQSTLESIGLKTVRDLKSKEIYNAKMLREYIQEQLTIR